MEKTLQKLELRAIAVVALIVWFQPAAWAASADTATGSMTKANDVVSGQNYNIQKDRELFRQEKNTHQEKMKSLRAERREAKRADDKAKFEAIAQETKAEWEGWRIRKKELLENIRRDREAKRANRKNFRKEKQRAHDR